MAAQAPRRTREGVNWDTVWRCERRRCAPFTVPHEDWLVGVQWAIMDPSDVLRQSTSLGGRSLGSVTTLQCQMRGYVPAPSRLRATCLHDGSYRLDSIGPSPRASATFLRDAPDVPYLTAWRAYDALENARQDNPALGLGGANLTELAIDLARWHKNYTINSTFWTQDIGTFKEAHCEIKKCDVNAF